ncbi:MAG: insulinase family protein [Bryobacterales bacterium]|nr:insulinase family protein [Bryobacterales bacterium]
MRAAILFLAAMTLAAQNPKDLKFPPLRPASLPDVKAVTLSNGMRVYLLEDRELPAVNGLALIRTGNLFDPPDKVGLAMLTGMAMRSGGAGGVAGDQIGRRLEEVAGSVESSIGETNGIVRFRAMRGGLDPVLEAFRDVLSAPDFNDEQLESVKMQLRGSIARRNDDAGAIAAREFISLVYGRDNSYGWQVEYEHLDRIGRDDLAAFHRRYFFPANVVLGIYGDFETPAMLARLESLFGGWTARQEPVPPFPKVEAEPAPGVYLAEKSDVTQTSFAVGHLGGRFDDKDYPALEVMAAILGGGSESRLGRRFRAREGDTYKIAAEWGAGYEHPGLFRVSGNSRSLSTLETLFGIEQEIARLRAEPAPETEVAAARQRVLDEFVFHFDTKSKTLGRLLTQDYHGYPADFLGRYQKAIAAVTPADIQRAARQHLDTTKLTFVVVGKPALFGKPLAGLGRPVQAIDLRIPEPSRAVTEESTARGKALLARVQEAMGGAEKLAAVRDVMQTSDVRLDPTAGGMRVRQVNRYLRPSILRQELDLPFGKVASFFNGRGGWVKSPQGSQPLLGPQLDQARGEVFRAILGLVLSDRDQERTVSEVRPGVVAIADKNGNASELTVDRSSGLPRRQTYTTAQGPVEERYEEYVAVDGIRYPKRMVVLRGGNRFSEVDVIEVRINTGVTEEELGKRE